jgi:uncharacterized glyoxalase superfamily protein PhnB
VDNVVKSAEYYRDVLGFTFNRYWGDPPCFVMLERDGVQFFIGGRGPRGTFGPTRWPNPTSHGTRMVNCGDADSLYWEFKAKGTEITREPEVTFYEMKEFELKDCNWFWAGYVRTRIKRHRRRPSPDGEPREAFSV